MTRRGSRRRGGGRRRAVDETARDGSPYRLRLVAHDPHGLRLVLQRRLEPDALVPPALPLGARRERRTSTRACTTRGTRATSRVNDAFADAVVEPSSSASRTRRSSSTTTTSTSRRGFVRERAPGRDARALRPHPVAAAGLLARAAEADPRRAVHDGLLANDIVGFHTRPLAAELPAHGRRPRRRELRLRATASRATTAARRSSTRHPISVDPAEFEELGGERRRARARSRRSSARGPSCSSCASTAPTRRRTSSAASARSSCYLDDHPEMHGRVGMLALLDPSRQDIPEYAEYLGAIQRTARAVNDRFQQRRLDADRPAGRRRLPAVGRGVQAVRRPARERDLRRHEPGREGGAARQRARRRARALRERGRPRGARRVGADGEPVRHLRPGRGDPPGARDAAARSGKQRLEAIRAHVREHDVSAWIAAQLADLDRWATAAPR